jgi:threonine dehydrogenase-like Zn-dependent dehydrogenase
MRSLVLDLEHRRLEELELPEPLVRGDRDVLFRVQEVGVCGTDRELVSFRLPWREGDASAIVIGHEALGQVLETGTAVDGIRPGDWVVPMIRRPCAGDCPPCSSARPDLCVTGGYTERGIFGLDGYFSEFAVDEADFLVTVPERLLDYAILIEPLSVVEKAVGRALAIRQTEGRSALVLGLGPIGMLAALVLSGRGYRAQIYSLEPEDHPRAALLRAHGVAYSTNLTGRFDVIIEAAGSAELALHAIRLLGPSGVFVTLGAQRARGEFSFVDLIVGNQTVLGSVNADRGSFIAALRDLESLPAQALRSMIRRFGFSDYRETLSGRGGVEPKFVHVIDGG